MSRKYQKGFYMKLEKSSQSIKNYKLKNELSMKCTVMENSDNYQFE